MNIISTPTDKRTQQRFHTRPMGIEHAHTCARRDDCPTSQFPKLPKLQLRLAEIPRLPLQDHEKGVLRVTVINPLACERCLNRRTRSCRHPSLLKRTLSFSSRPTYTPSRSQSRWVIRSTTDYSQTWMHDVHHAHPCV